MDQCRQQTIDWARDSLRLLRWDCKFDSSSPLLDLCRGSDQRLVWTGGVEWGPAGEQIQLPFLGLIECYGLGVNGF